MFVYKQLLRILKHRGEDLLLFSMLMRGINVIIGALVAFIISTAIEFKTGELALNAEFLNWIDVTYAALLISSGIVLLFFSVVEIVGLIYISHSYERSERPTMVQVCTYAYSKTRTLSSAYGLSVCIVMVFAFLFFPLLNIGPSVFSRFSIPSFVASELITTPGARMVSIAVVLMLIYVIYRFIFSFHVFATRSLSFIGACKASWMITSRRKNLRELCTFAVGVPVLISAGLLLGTGVLVLGIVGVFNAVILLFSSLLPESFVVLFYSIWVFSSTALVSLIFAPSIISALTAYLEVRHPLVLGMESVHHIHRPDMPFLRHPLFKWLFGSTRHIFVFGMIMFICFALVSRTYLEIIETTHHTPRIISHRGLTEGAYRPSHVENTLDSFTRAVDAGVDGIETDLQILRDGTVIFFHDEKINTASGTIPITDLTYDELARYGIQTTTLVELSKSPIFTCDRTWFFEIKEYANTDHTVHILDTILDIAKDRNMYECIYVGSFNLDRVYAFKSHAPKLRTNLYVYNIVRDMSSEIDVARVDALSIEESLLTSSFARTFLNQRKDIYVWTVNDVSRVATAALFGVTGVITDIPIAVRESLIASGMYTQEMMSGMASTTRATDRTNATHITNAVPATAPHDIKIVRLFGKVFILDLREIWNFRFSYSL